MDKKEGIDGLFELFNNPRAILNEGEKISSADSYLMKKGGFGAFFNPGISCQDAMAGNISKRTLIIEDNNSLRERIAECFKKTGLTTFCAQDYKTALRLIYPRFENVKRFSYAIIDDKFPEKRGEEAKFLADKVIDELIKEHPYVRIFGYLEDEESVDKSRYVAVLKKGSVSLDELYKIVIADAETDREGRE